MHNNNGDVKECDVLVIGGGGSGALACLEASKDGELNVILVSQGPISRSGLTPTGNGGTAVSDSPEDLFTMMVKAGNYLNDQNIVWLMSNEVHNSLKKLRDLGVPVKNLAAGSACVHGVETLAIARKELSRRPNVALFEDVMITRLIQKDGAIRGAVAWNLISGKVFIIQTKAIVLATGGMTGELYSLSSNNPFGVSTDAAGTGHVMAYLAGADLIDMEMIAFVPLPLNAKCKNIRFFPEFWQGPYMNRTGKIIEGDVNQYWGGSYSYQFVQKIFKELDRGNGPIIVDRRGKNEKYSKFPIPVWERRRNLIKKLGIDPVENKIEIGIGSHFCMGGIYVDEKMESTIKGLFAAGEVMGGVHGGLRLPGKSFTQMIVFGFEAGRNAASYAMMHNKISDSFSEEITQEKEKIYNYVKKKKNPISLSELKKKLHGVMDRDVFVFRDKNGLESAIQEIREIKKDIYRINVPTFMRFNLDWIRAMEFSLMIEGAEIIASSALFREESRGFHYRNDFPKKDDKNWLIHTVTRFREERLEHDTAPVVLSRMKPEV